MNQHCLVNYNYIFDISLSSNHLNKHLKKFLEILSTQNYAKFFTEKILRNPKHSKLCEIFPIKNS